MKHKERISKLRKLMADRGIDIYVVFLADDHGSETVGSAFMEVEYLCGFSGSNATMVITKDEAGLWTDGRYFIQAENQIKKSSAKLFRMGEEGVPDVLEYVKSHLKKDMRLAYDGRRICLASHESFEEAAKKAGAKLSIDCNLLDEIWTDRPKAVHHHVWILEEEYAGKSVSKKIKEVRKEIKKNGSSGIILSSLYDIAWLLNLRGNDIFYVPVFTAYLFLDEKICILYADKKAFSKEVKKYLKDNGIKLRSYGKIYEEAGKLKAKSIQADPYSLNAALSGCIPHKVKLIKAPNPTELLKAKKNKTEIKNTKQAHLMDGIAVTRFIYYIKKNIGKSSLTECSAAEYLHGLRALNDTFLEESFPTISAYGANAAMMHYEPDRRNDVVLEPKGFLLVDSGGHYLEGTTDITRTITLGELSEEERRGYTLTLRGALRLMAARFPKGVYSQSLDVLARGPFWDEGLDYRCGTGHGVGHILNVHEGPNAFRQRINDHLPACELLPGMITTDEPGLYEEGKFGIRIENELLCVKDKKTDYGQYLKFENLTLAPIDLEPVIPGMLTEYEKQTLNEYHRCVYEMLSPHLSDEEREWLKKETREIP